MASVNVQSLLCRQRRTLHSECTQNRNKLCSTCTGSFCIELLLSNYSFWDISGSWPRAAAQARHRRERACRRSALVRVFRSEHRLCCTLPLLSRVCSTEETAGILNDKQHNQLPYLYRPGRHHSRIDYLTAGASWEIRVFPSQMPCSACSRKLQDEQRKARAEQKAENEGDCYPDPNLYSSCFIKP